MRIAATLWTYVDTNGLGVVLPAPTDVVLSPTDVVQPDVLFVRADRAGSITELNVQGPPDLCIEVLSPGMSERDQQEKRDLYARFGVREYWLVDADAQRITVLSLDAGTYTRLVEAAGDDTVRSAVLPGFVVAARELFPRA